MKKTTLLLFMLISSWLSIGQVQVGDDTGTTTLLPISSCYGYTYSQQIYFASDINASGDITALSFYLDAASSTSDFSSSDEWTVYLGHSTKTEFASTSDWEPVANLTQAFTGVVTFPAEDNWFTLTLDAPFTYNGTDNLIVAIDENKQGYNCSMSWRKTDGAANIAMYYRSDSTNPDPASPLDASARLSYTSNIIFEGIAQTCPSPSGLTATNITTTSADLDWTIGDAETSWNIEYGELGFTQGTGTIVSETSTKPYSLTGLNPSATYEFYVQAFCGAGEQSAWIGPYSFATLCDAFTTPLTESFENGGTIPNCWSTYSTGTRVWDFNTSPTFGNDYFDNTSGSGYFAYVDASTSDTATDATLETPEIDVTSLTTPYLKFYVHHYVAGGTNSNTITVDVWDGAAWNQVYMDGNGDVDAWEMVGIDLSSLTITGNIKVRFVVDTETNSNYENDIAIDDMSIIEAPTCPEPLSLNVSNINHDSADLVWTVGSSETAWNIELVDLSAGGTQTMTATNAGVTSNPFTITGLIALNNYEFYVQADCGGGDLSAWSGPFSFSTGCDPTPLDVPFLDNFEAATVCGTVINEGTGNEWTYSSTMGAGFTTNHMRYSYNYSNPADSWYFTQAINLVAGQEYYISYDFGNSGSWDEKMKVAYGTANTSAAMTTVLADYPAVSGGDLQSDSVTFTAPATGVYYFGFHAYSDANMNQLRLDNIVVDQSLSTESFDNLNSFRYYPNPVNNTLTLNAKQNIDGVAVYNMLGQEVLRTAPNTVNTEVNMSALRTGAYFVKVTIGNATETVRIIKN
ncbi:putative secreted protein (Por secretion system target) [Oceanihabitans sediminis]|uniref:T9SS C-terminal target domain-containing protein n=1 Tax=Oceanihabitans sediminis TaxID=1812012 RepID=A0A368P5H5_9FLAO|nr:fibronectin type III domain-containing protein [Oceanihabitans sediminis]RBP32711.1 putative secreted protein (Por secretion system target) [Oceanihabitans sediminis]RCU57748.1 T9SS C-terminal target domain-containing protein [Oceanihabitans sediminis]